VGRKAGMTRIFTEDGASIPVTVIEVEPNRVTYVRTPEKEGYAAIQVTTGAARRNRTPKPEAGHFAKAGVAAGRGLWEFRAEGVEEAFAVGNELTVARFAAGQRVDVKAYRKARATPGPLSAGTSAVRMPPTATRSRTACLVRSARTRPRAGCSRARRCPGTSATKQSPPRTSKSYAWMLTGICSC